MNIAVLLAGGMGKRIDSNIPKQHIVVNQHQIIEYTLSAFSASDIIDAILVISNEKYIDEIEKLRFNYPKMKWVIKGGETRIKSVYNAVYFLNNICKPEDNIIISDAARPCITLTEINSIVLNLENYIAITTGIECYETILKIENGEINEIIPRDGVIRQTSPEGYKFNILKELYIETCLSDVEKYRNIGIDQLFEKGEKIAIIKSNPLNFKITTEEDLHVFETVIKKGFAKIINNELY